MNDLLGPELIGGGSLFSDVVPDYGNLVVAAMWAQRDGSDAVVLLFYGFKALSLWLRRPGRNPGLSEDSFTELASLAVQITQRPLWMKGDPAARPPPGKGGMDEYPSHEAYADALLQGAAEYGVEEPLQVCIARLSANREFLSALKRAGGAGLADEAKKYFA